MSHRPVEPRVPSFSVEVDGDRATLVVRRFLRHPPREVWRAITEPEQLRRWYLTVASIEARPGGAIDFVTGDAWVHATGRILTWQPPSVFEHEWNVAPGSSAYGTAERTVVRWELTPRSGGTLLVLTHRGLSRKVADVFRHGLPGFLDRLEAQLDDRPLPDWGRSVRDSRRRDGGDRPSRDVTVRRVTTDEWPALRELRLRALGADPLAFGSTLERERAFDDERWRERTALAATSSASAQWVAVDRSGLLLGSITVAEHEGAPHLFGMWVAPERRSEGIGTRLLDAGLSWARSSFPGGTVLLDVNPRQAAAVRIYESRGFRATGARRPLGHTDGESVVEMALGSGGAEARHPGRTPPGDGPVPAHPPRRGAAEGYSKEAPT